MMNHRTMTKTRSDSENGEMSTGMDVKRAHPSQSQQSNPASTVNRGAKTECISTASQDPGLPPVAPTSGGLTQQPPPAAGQGNGNNSNNLGSKTVGGVGGHLRLGGISRFLLEKAQSNDSGLDLSPATLQTLVHPLRSSNSSTSSLHVRTLFESPVSPDESESPQPGPADASSEIHQSHYYEPSNPLVSRSGLSEQSHNSSASSESTIIEKTLTDDSTSKNHSRRDCPEPILEGNPTALKETTNAAIHKHQHVHQQRTFTNPDDVTPKEGTFQVPYGHYHQQKDKSRQSYSITNNVENTDPARTPSHRGSNTYSHHQNNNLPSADIAAVIPSTVAVPNEMTRKVTQQTPKVKSTKKKQPVPATTKKPGGWKFLSEHVHDKEFLILEQLGKGGCGEVSLVMEKDTRRQFALKIVQLHGIQEALVQECINEVEMLIDLKGTDLVVDIHSWEFNRSERTMKILMEKGQCDLNYTISKSIRANRPMRLLKIKYIWESLLVIVDKIHTQGIVHADLKPANFVWVDDNLKIIDFGIASRLQNDLTSIAMPNPKGTLNFISPEIIRLDESGRSKLSPKSDIWALGCILYLMVYGRTPFEHISHPVAKMNAIVQADIMYPPLPPHLYGSEVVSVLKLCFQADYKRRPVAADLLRHPFLHS